MFNHDLLSNFNELELSIYNCITKNKERIAHMKIKELADEAHVSTATILRFCRKVGCDGYSEFKIRYKEYLEHQSLSLHDSGENTLKSFLSRIDSRDFQESLDHAFSLLKSSSRIIFIGVGTSGVLGKYGARYFSNVGHFSLFIDDPWLPILQDLSERTVTIAISESGNTSQVLLLANQLKERGSLLISITNQPDTPLSKIADRSISYHVPQLKANDTNLTTSVPVIYILEALAKRFCQQQEIPVLNKNDGFF